jgi:hypothetical protein
MPSFDDLGPAEKADGTARVVSAAYDAVSKYAAGRKEAHGRRAWLLSRTLQRFVDSVRQEAGAFAAGAGAGLPNDVKAAIVAASATPVPGAYVLDFATRGYADNFATRMKDLFLTGLYNTVTEAVEQIERTACRTPKSITAHTMVLGGMLAGGMAIGAGNIHWLPFSAGLVAWGYIRQARSESSARNDLEVTREIGAPMSVRRKAAGRYSAEPRIQDLPSAEFLELARAMMADRIGDEALADRQFTRLDEVFSELYDEPVVIETLGVRLDIPEGRYEIRAPGADGKVVAWQGQASGFVVEDQNEYDRLMARSASPAP